MDGYRLKNGIPFNTNGITGVGKNGIKYILITTL